jgi:hypothetical protein
MAPPTPELVRGSRRLRAWRRADPGRMSEPPNNEMNLTKPAQAMEVRRLSWCSADYRPVGRQ